MRHTVLAHDPLRSLVVVVAAAATVVVVVVAVVAVVDVNVVVVLLLLLLLLLLHGVSTRRVPHICDERRGVIAASQLSGSADGRETRTDILFSQSESVGLRMAPRLYN